MSKHSKTYLRVVKTVYVTNNNVTVCTMTADPGISLKYLNFLKDNKRCSPIIQKFFKVDSEEHPYLVITQKTRCIGGDSFDELKGKRIAESKCKAKAFDILSKIYEAFGRNSSRVAGKYNTLTLNCKRVYCNELKHIQELQK